jgi:hypothetical protein
MFLNNYLHFITISPFSPIHQHGYEFFLNMSFHVHEMYINLI